MTTPIYSQNTAQRAQEIALGGRAAPAAGGGGGYTLPVATTLVLGGVKAGSGVSIAADGSLSASGVGGGSGTGVDATDVGFDIVLLAGQSNMAGRGALDTLVDVLDPRVLQFGGASGDGRYRTIFAGMDPLHNAEGVNTGQMSLGTAAAKAYSATLPTNRKVLIVPCASGGTRLVGSVWAAGSPGGTLYENAITQTNLAVTAAQLQYPNSRVVGIFWHQGESDGDSSITQAAYAAGLSAVIAGFRARITGAANAWMIIGGMVPTAISGNATYGLIDLAHKQVALATDKTTFVAGPTGVTGDNLHYNAAGARIMGARMGLAVQIAKAYSATPVPASAVTIGVSASSGAQGVGVTVTAGTNNPLTGPQTEAVTLSANVAGTFSVNPVNLNAGTATGTSVFTPSATGVATITGTAAGTPTLTNGTTSYTVTAVDSIAPILSAPTGTQTGATTATGTVTTDEGNGTLYSLATLNATETAATVKAGGSTQTITSAGAKNVAATALTTGSVYYWHYVHRDAAGNDSGVAHSAGFTPASASFATFSPADKNATWALSNANLTATNSGSAWTSARANTGKSVGKWYWEVTYTGANRMVIGIGDTAVPLTGFPGQAANDNGFGLYAGDGSLFHTGVNSLTGTSSPYVQGDVIGVALDMDAKTLRFYKNGTAVGTAPYTNLPAVTMFPMIGSEGAGYAATANFGASAFAYTPPAGHVGLA